LARFWRAFGIFLGGGGLNTPNPPPRDATVYKINSLVFIVEVESVYSAVGTESLYNTHFSSLTLILLMWRIWCALNNASKWQMEFGV